jgi:chemotaxis-related protein WspD
MTLNRDSLPDFGPGCWKRIGVWGNEKPPCPLLDEVIHCRNCEVFTRSGRNLLEREVTEDYRREWTDIMVQKKSHEEPGTISVVIFKIEKEWLALKTRIFAEVVDPGRILHHTIPHRKNPVLKGIFNVHGDMQLCVSLKELLGIEKDPDKIIRRQDYRRMMVINGDGGQWVFPVDEIVGIHRIHPKMFENVPVTVAKAQSTYTKGMFYWKDKHVAFLDEELMLYSLTRSIQ